MLYTGYMLKKTFHSKPNVLKRFDFILFGLTTLLTLFGLLMIFDASSVLAFEIYGDKYNFIKDQIVWVILGYSALYFFYLFDYKKLYNLALPGLLISLFMLILVFIPGVGSATKGASRWINIFSFRLQPSEIVKLALAIYLAAWFSHKEKGRLLAFIVLMGAVMLLVMLQPDMGTASIILFEAVMIYFFSGGSVFHFLIGAPIIAVIGFILIKIEPYRMARLTSFLNLGNSFQDTSYHVRQVLIALGSGGIFGLGIGNSIQKYAYLPENATDSIFPIIAEEFGFIGSTILIITFAILVIRGFYIASRARDNFGKLLAAGITSFIGIQIVINLGAMTALLPLTGVPLPFISYGGSALILNLASIGILLNIAKQADY
jgi:cell division protein FtsW